jgi:hypothetical protein
MKDQYGNAVPADLAVLPDFWLLSPAEVEIVDNLDWYECRGILLVPQNEVGGDDPRDAGLEVDPDGNLTGKVMKVDTCLHRYSEEDGFYHA